MSKITFQIFVNCTTRMSQMALNKVFTLYTNFYCDYRIRVSHFKRTSGMVFTLPLHDVTLTATIYGGSRVSSTAQFAQTLTKRVWNDSQYQHESKNPWTSTSLHDRRKKGTTLRHCGRNAWNRNGLIIHSTEIFHTIREEALDEFTNSQTFRLPKQKK